MTAFVFGIDNILNWFRRPPAIHNASDLTDFIDRHAAFSVQKCIVEYCRARTGILSPKLFKEKDFLASVNHARWRGFGIGVANVTEMTAAALLPHATKNPQAVFDAIAECGRRVLQRYPVPEGEPDDFWTGALGTYDARMAALRGKAPKPVKDIPLATAKEIYKLMPIHKELRSHDFELIQNNQRLNLCRSYETFVASADIEALVEDLGTPRKPVSVPAV